MNRQATLIDALIIPFDNALRTLFSKPSSSYRAYPADNIEESSLTTAEKKQVAALMRINHAGEVSAQGLYQGQALTAKNASIKLQLQQSALEEQDHLYWCKTRLQELESRTSYLNPLWYGGSFAIGIAAGLISDQWSLGFVEETEYQVMAHLDKHLSSLPAQDLRTKKILEQLKSDESHHAAVAKELGAKSLPLPVKKIMGMLSKVMTKTAYWV